MADEEQRDPTMCPHHQSLYKAIVGVKDNLDKFTEQYKKDKTVMVTNGDGTLKPRTINEITAEMYNYTKDFRINNRVKTSLKEWWKIRPLQTKIAYSVITLIICSTLTWASTKAVVTFEKILDSNEKVTTIEEVVNRNGIVLDTVKVRQDRVILDNKIQDSKIDSLSKNHKFK